MKISDPIYHIADIKEPVILEVLSSPALIRLKEISQYGLPDEYYHFSGYSRYEHSLGVMLLLRLLGSTLEEQIAGLLHDVSHLAFSHLADWVFAGGQKGIEEYQNRIHQVFIFHTDLPQILAKYNLDIKRVLNEENYPLLERLLPDLCADRVDYALREFYHWLKPEIAQPCLSSLTVFNRNIVFKKIDTAYLFSINYMRLQTEHWGGYEAMMRYHLFSELLKDAIKKKLILKKDFYGTERPILDKLEQSYDKNINSVLNIIKRRRLPFLKAKYGRHILKKFRYVDPLVLVEGSIKRLSLLLPGYLKIIKKHRQINKKGLFV